VNFEYLGLAPETLRAVEEAGYMTPTPIQAQAIPVVLQGRDVLGIAQTGTGKTASFTLPMIDILAQGRARARMPRSLILEPTRELAAQVAQSFETYGKYHKLNMALLIGGVSFDDQERKLDRGVDVLIATPGRLLDHFGRGKLMMNGVEILVIDEADRMLDMGFIPDVERICSLITKKHQTLFFSATMPREIQGLVAKFLNDPKRIEVAPPSSTASTVEQFLVPLYTGESGAKRAKLRELLRGEEIKNAIVFCNRKRDVDVVYRSLKKHGFNAAALHGDMDQGSRMEVLDSFKAGNIQLLVASDVAARGLDIPAMSHVFNYDVPSHAEDYIHRIGRTGRAGRSGRTFMISTPADAKWLRNVQNLIGKPINVMGAAAAGADSQAQIAPEDAILAAGEASDDKRGKRRRRRGGRGKNGPEEQQALQAEQQADEMNEPHKDREPHRPQGNGRDEPRRQESRRDERRETGRPETGRPETGRAETGRPETERRETGRRDDRRRDDRRDRGRDRDRNRRHHEDDFEPVVGLGDHVPEFLLRTFTIAPIRADDDEDEVELDFIDDEDDVPVARTTPAEREPAVESKPVAETRPAADETDSGERKSKRKRRSRGKKRRDGAAETPVVEAVAEAPVAVDVSSEPVASQPAAEAPETTEAPAKPKRVRKPRVSKAKADVAESAVTEPAAEPAAVETPAAEEAPKARPRRRTAKPTVEAGAAADTAPEAKAKAAPKTKAAPRTKAKPKAKAEPVAETAAAEAPPAKPKAPRKPRAPRKSPAEAA
jgi:superfamily II DNA/RNA helicase